MKHLHSLLLVVGLIFGFSEITNPFPAVEHDRREIEIEIQG